MEIFAPIGRMLDVLRSDESRSPYSGSVFCCRIQYCPILRRDVCRGVARRVPKVRPTRKSVAGCPAGAGCVRQWGTCKNRANRDRGRRDDRSGEVTAAACGMVRRRPAAGRGAGRLSAASMPFGIFAAMRPLTGWRCAVVGEGITLLAPHPVLRRSLWRLEP